MKSTPYRVVYFRKGRFIRNVKIAVEELGCEIVHDNLDGNGEN